MIESRDELIAALNEAAELEHGLLVQYIFAALSLKRDVGDGVSARSAELARGWAGQMMKIARDEMAHLGNVCNMLTAIGGATRFGRPNFPQPGGRYYPFDFTLERFSSKTLVRFMRFEQPRGEHLPEAAQTADGPRVGPPEYDYVGELYQAIATGFSTIDEKELFIGPRFAQDADDWSNPGRFRLFLVKDRASAIVAIDAIVAEGEGAPGHREGSHFATFRKIHEEYRAAGEPDVVHPVVSNPRTRSLEDAPIGGTIITDEFTLRVARLFNDVYAVSLWLLTQYYSYSGESAAQRAELQLLARSAMGCGVRPLAEVLTTLPVGADAEFAGSTAGAPFEILRYPSIPNYVPNRWVLLDESLRAAAAEARALSDDATPAVVADRLRFLAENLRIMSARVLRVAAQGVH